MPEPFRLLVPFELELLLFEPEAFEFIEFDPVVLLELVAGAPQLPVAGMLGAVVGVTTTIVGIGVAVGCGVEVAVGSGVLVAVGKGVLVGSGVLVGNGVLVGIGVTTMTVGAAVGPVAGTPQAAMVGVGLGRTGPVEGTPQPVLGTSVGTGVLMTQPVPPVEGTPLEVAVGILITWPGKIRLKLLICGLAASSEANETPNAWAMLPMVSPATTV